MKKHISIGNEAVSTKDFMKWLNEVRNLDIHCLIEINNMIIRHTEENFIRTCNKYNLSFSEIADVLYAVYILEVLK